MNVTVYAPDIPVELRKNQSRGRAVKRMALEALDMGLEPVSMPREGLVRLSIALTENESKMMGVGDSENQGRLLGELCYAHLLQIQKQSKGKKTKNGERKEQQEYYQSIIPPFQAGKIVVAEGGTGLGKSRVLAWLARDVVQAGNRPVCIAVPTIAVMLHMLSEWQAIDAAGTQIAFLLGRSQFVDLDKLITVLTDPEAELSGQSRDKVLEWLDDDCPPLAETGNDKLAAVVPDIGYLHSDLLYLAPEMAAFSGLRMERKNEDENDSPAEKIYQELFAGLDEADVIICSHAMLAMDMQARKMNRNGGILPEIHALLVDEAHGFEKTVASAASVKISLLTLRSALRTTAQGSKVNRARAIKMCNGIIRAGQRLEQDNFFIRPSAESAEIPSEIGAILNSFEELKDAVRRLFPKKGYVSVKLKDQAARIVQTELSNLYRISSRKQPILIKLSPVRKYISAVTGPATVKHLFVDLWNRLPGGCVLASATLTLPDKYNQPSAEYIQRLLNIPPARCHVITPVVPGWTIKPVRLHIPEPHEMDILTPPRETAEESDNDPGNPYRQWVTAVTRKIAATANSAQGGTLILLTSYSLLDQIREELPGEITARAIFQDGSKAFGALKEEYIQAAATGQRPVWFAMGAAWEGMDLSGKSRGIPPEQDNILSDLVIPRLPFGLNNSLASYMRNLRFQGDGGYKSFPVSGRNDTAFLLRQGIGRMVRRGKVPIKKIWILDGRIWTKSQKFYGVFQRILARYKRSSRV